MGDYQQTFHLALDIAQTYGAELTLLHVLDPDVKELVNPERTLEWARNALEALARQAGDLVRAIDTSVTSGEVAEEVLKEAIRTQADWIVLGADGGFPFWSFRETVAIRSSRRRTARSLRFAAHRAYAMPRIWKKCTSLSLCDLEDISGHISSS